jgi:hypothetical protein
MDRLKVLLAMITGLTKGAITPESLSVSGALEPEIASQFVDLMTKESGFLSRITTRKTRKLTGTIKLFDIEPRFLVRVAQGSDPTSGQLAEPTRDEVDFAPKNVNAFFQLLYDTIRDNQDNPQFEQQFEAMIARRFARDIVVLGFEGVADDYAGSAFTALNKGWNQRAKDDLPAGQLVDTVGETSILDIFDLCIAAMPDNYRMRGETTFVVSPTDYDRFVQEMSVTGYQVLEQAKLTGTLPSYKGYPVLEVVEAVSDEIHFGPLANFVYAVLISSIERGRQVDAIKRCIDYAYEMPCDYFIGVPKAHVFAYNQGGS